MSVETGAIRVAIAAARRADPSRRLSAAAGGSSGGAPLRGLVAATLAAFLGGCATAEKLACERGDWEGLGFRDGRAGLGYEQVATRTERCAVYGIDVDSSAWTTGYRDGIERYCEPTRGFDLGESAGEYTGNCPRNVETRYLASYVRGLGVRRDGLQLAYDRLRRDLDDTRRRREALDPEADADDLEERIDELEGELEDNLAARRDVNERLGRWSRRL